MRLIPVNCTKHGMAAAITSWGLYFLYMIFLNGCLIVFEILLALMRSSNSAWTSLVPLMLCSTRLALSWLLVFWIKLLGESGSIMAPSVRIDAETAARDRETHHPQPPSIFSVPNLMMLVMSTPMPIPISKTMFHCSSVLRQRHLRDIGWYWLQRMNKSIKNQ